MWYTIPTTSPLFPVFRSAPSAAQFPSRPPFPVTWLIVRPAPVTWVFSFTATLWIPQCPSVARRFLVPVSWRSHPVGETSATCVHKRGLLFQLIKQINIVMVGFLLSVRELTHGDKPEGFVDLGFSLVKISRKQIWIWAFVISNKKKMKPQLKTRQKHVKLYHCNQF